jgi:hypothetical protein
VTTVTYTEGEFGIAVLFPRPLAWPGKATFDEFLRMIRVLEEDCLEVPLNDADAEGSACA